LAIEGASFGLLAPMLPLHERPLPAFINDGLPAHELVRTNERGRRHVVSHGNHSDLLVSGANTFGSAALIASRRA
jgi:hypothetical protein